MDREQADEIVRVRKLVANFDLKEAHLAFLRTLPRQVLANYLSDSASYEIGMTVSTFALGMQPRFINTTPLEMFDLCAAVIREHVAARKPNEHH